MDSPQIEHDLRSALAKIKMALEILTPGAAPDLSESDRAILLEAAKKSQATLSLFFEAEFRARRISK